MTNRTTTTAQRQNDRVRGFTAVELLTVTTIIGIVSAIAVPNFQGAKITGNETAAVASMRTIASAAENFRTRYGFYPGAVSGDGLADLSDPNADPAPLIDEILGSGQKSGYDFEFSGNFVTWECIATPTESSTGFRSFYLDNTGLCRVEADYATNGAATANSPFLD